MSRGSGTTNQNLTLPTEDLFTTAFVDAMGSEEPAALHNDPVNNLIYIPQFVKMFKTSTSSDEGDSHY